MAGCYIRISGLAAFQLRQTHHVLRVPVQLWQYVIRNDSNLRSACGEAFQLSTSQSSRHKKTASLSPYCRIVTCVKYVEKGPCTRYFGPYLSCNRLQQEQKKRWGFTFTLYFLLPQSLVYQCLILNTILFLDSAKSTKCPRTNSKAFRYCTKRTCTSNGDCKSNEKCLCDGDCGMSCVRDSK